MTIALIIILFIIQLVTIFVIVILNSKLSKFQDLEKRQNELVNEMDNAITVYLMEMREENDRLINELKKPIVPQYAEAPASLDSSSSENDQQEIVRNEATVKQASEEKEIEPRKFVPVKQAAHAYQKHKTEHVLEMEEATLVEAELFSKDDGHETEQLKFEQQVVEYYRNGKTIEEIAKTMQRGKTEIELLLKFHA